MGTDDIILLSPLPSPSNLPNDAVAVLLPVKSPIGIDITPLPETVNTGFPDISLASKITSVISVGDEKTSP